MLSTLPPVLRALIERQPPAQRFLLTFGAALFTVALASLLVSVEGASRAGDAALAFAVNLGLLTWANLPAVFPVVCAALGVTWARDLIHRPALDAADRLPFGVLKEPELRPRDMLFFGAALALAVSFATQQKTIYAFSGSPAYAVALYCSIALVVAPWTAWLTRGTLAVIPMVMAGLYAFVCGELGPDTQSLTELAPVLARKAHLVTVALAMVVGFCFLRALNKQAEQSGPLCSGNDLISDALAEDIALASLGSPSLK